MSFCYYHVRSVLLPKAAFILLCVSLSLLFVCVCVRERIKARRLQLLCLNGGPFTYTPLLFILLRSPSLPCLCSLVNYFSSPTSVELMWIVLLALYSILFSAGNSLNGSTLVTRAYLFALDTALSLWPHSSVFCILIIVALLLFSLIFYSWLLLIFFLSWFILCFQLHSSNLFFIFGPLFFFLFLLFFPHHRLSLLVHYHRAFCVFWHMKSIR